MAATNWINKITWKIHFFIRIYEFKIAWNRVSRDHLCTYRYVFILAISIENNCFNLHTKKERRNSKWNICWQILKTSRISSHYRMHRMKTMRRRNFFFFCFLFFFFDLRSRRVLQTLSVRLFSHIEPAIVLVYGSEIDLFGTRVCLA